jgi:metal-responsive CopG/Arc/MetJ family transcriptional regulator
MATSARKIVATALSADELAELDRVCERQDLSRAEAVRTAIRWYIDRASRLPPADQATSEELEAIERGEAEFADGESRALEDVQRELGLPTC